MQHLKALSEIQLVALEAAIRSDRIERYMPPKTNNKKAALQFYLWNCALCESFYTSIHFSEILTRNSVLSALHERFGPCWYDNKLFHAQLDERIRHDFNSDIYKERNIRGGSFNINNVIEGLRFCFWEHLTTKRFERLLWAKGVRQHFMCANASLTRQEIHDLIEMVRRWRNTVMHHGAIFDKEPLKKHQLIIELIGYSSSVAAEWVKENSRVLGVFKNKPFTPR